MHVLTLPKNPDDPFYFHKKEYDLKTTFDRENLLKVCNRVIPQCFKLRISHKILVAFIFERTIPWGKVFERITYDQFIDGVFDSNGAVVATGTKMSRRTVAKCLNELHEMGIILMQVHSIPGKRDKYFYAINFGAGVKITQKDGTSHTSKGRDYFNLLPKEFNPVGAIAPTAEVKESIWKNESPELTEKEPAMIPLSKRRKAAIQEENKGLTEEEEFERAGQEPTPETDKQRFTSTPVSVYIDQDRFTSVPEIEADRFTFIPQTIGGIKIENKQSEQTGVLNSTHETPKAKVEKQLREFEANKRIQRKQLTASSFEVNTIGLVEMEAVWKYAFEEVYNATHIRWSGKEKGQMKILQSKWADAKTLPFAGFIDWVIRRWQNIGQIWFNSVSYPEQPAIGFLTVCFRTYVQAYDKSQLVDEEPGMSKKEKFIARLRVRGWEESKIVALVEKRFPTVKANEVDKLKIEFELARQEAMHRGQEEYMRRERERVLQPVAKPEVRKVESPEIKIETFEAWK